MRLGWNRAEDGVITVYAHTNANRTVPIADFWLKPMADVFGSRHNAKNKQQELAEFLVAAWNASGKASIFADIEDEESPYYYHPDEDDIPTTARRFVEIPQEASPCWLSVPGCSGNCGSYGCGG